MSINYMIMENAVKQRIKEITSLKDISITALSKIIQVPQPTLNRQINTEAPMTLSNILLILNHFSDISAEWLLRGVGDMYKDVEASTNIETEEDDSPKDKFYKDIIFTYQEMAKEYRKKIEYLEAELAKAVPFTEEEKKQSKSA